MKKQINGNLFVLLALIIISITAIGSVSACEDSQSSHLTESDSSNALNDHFNEDVISDDSDDDDSEYDDDDDLDDDDDYGLDDDSDDDDDWDDDDDLDDDDWDDDDDLDDDDWDDDDDLDDDDFDYDDLDEYIDEDYQNYLDLMNKYHQLINDHPDVYSKLIPYIIYIVNDNGNISNTNFTDIFKDKEASSTEEPSNESESDENPQEIIIEEEYSFENATQKLLELIENDESLSDSSGNLTLKLTGLVNKIVEIVNSSENFTADFKLYLEDEISAENSTENISEYLDFLTFIYDLINYAENHTDENFTLLDIYKDISSDYHLCLASGFGFGSYLPKSPDYNDSYHPIAFDMKINDKINNGFNNSDKNATTMDSLTDNVSTQSTNPFNLIILILVLLAVIIGVKIKRDNN